MRRSNVASARSQLGNVRGGKLMDNIDMKLLRLLRSTPMHTAQIAKLLGVTENEVLHRMGRLQELGLVEYVGPEAMHKRDQSAKKGVSVSVGNATTSPRRRGEKTEEGS
jgi:DNA-binding Lrp family transcriptional regulator